MVGSTVGKGNVTHVVSVVVFYKGIQLLGIVAVVVVGNRTGERGYPTPVVLVLLVKGI